jgi:hypothetical protein
MFLVLCMGLTDGIGGPYTLRRRPMCNTPITPFSISFADLLCIVSLVSLQPFMRLMCLMVANV